MTLPLQAGECGPRRLLVKQLWEVFWNSRRSPYIFLINYHWSAIAKCSVSIQGKCHPKGSSLFLDLSPILRHRKHSFRRPCSVNQVQAHYLRESNRSSCAHPPPVKVHL